VIAFALATLGLATLASADARARQPALDQYVPSLPGATGDQTPRLGGPASPAALPPALRARLRRQRDGGLLLRIATAPGLGAPSRASASRHGHGGGVPASGSDSAPAPGGSTFAAARDAVREPAVLALLGGMLLSMCALLGLALVQRRRG
jgi:hypothetical protein